MAIVVKNKNIKEEIVDEKGNILGYISYNPEDVKSFRKLSDIIDLINNISENSKNLNKLEMIQDEDVSLENFDKYKDLFEDVRSDLHTIDDTIEVIKENIDNIFGKGTSNIFMGDGHDLDLLMPLLDDVMPKFKNQRKEQVNKYLDSQNAVL